MSRSYKNIVFPNKTLENIFAFYEKLFVLKNGNIQEGNEERKVNERQTEYKMKND